MGQTLCLNHAHINTLRYISAVLFFTGPLIFFWGGGSGGGLPFVLSVKLPPQGRGIFLPRRHHDGAKGNSGVSARTAGDLYRNKTSFNHRSSLIRITPVNPTPARNLVCVLRHTQKTDMSGIRRPRGIERERERKKSPQPELGCGWVSVAQFQGTFLSAASDLVNGKEIVQK